MKYTDKKSNNLTDKEKIELINYIIDDCVNYAGDSYSDFAREVIRDLRMYNLVDYGEEE